MNTTTDAAGGFDPALAAKRLIREARTAALGTLDPDGAPYVSLVTVATLPDGAPVLLLSRLARHTRNLAADPRVSLLVDERRAGDPLEGARVSLTGTIAATPDETARRRFLARHPEAEGYAGFADFTFYRIDLTGGHLVAGFGRIVDLDAADLTTDLAGAEGLLAAEAGAVAHMNEDHADAVAAYATGLLKAPAGDWVLIGIDPEGCDIMADGVVRRLDFPRRVDNPRDMRIVLVELAHRARGGEGSAASH
ncbi:HugZ family pyridoxamine 5'-phosphate oxidase [Ancylobacter terrae]|uniref:HugZ family pyridoxamine 5'-phosphate oxidase n=1 Tax=Ancylobacter sp. sgz301288 TaxID=3342077 RepID=UPI00385C11D9